MPFPLPVELVRKACIIFSGIIPVEEEVSNGGVAAEFEFCIPPPPFDELVVVNVIKSVAVSSDCNSSVSSKLSDEAKLSEPPEFFSDGFEFILMLCVDNKLIVW